MDTIEKELQYYSDKFKDKVIYCNCDNPAYSNFWKYFENNFDKLGLKKLISTYYSSDKSVSKLELSEHGKIQTPLKGNGDFRSPECIELLKEVDMVVTNPPFSLFREYVAQLYEYNKKFLIIGNLNAITYKNVFKLIQEKKIWLGESIHSGSVWFEIPKKQPILTKNFRIDESEKKFISFGSIRWWTNIEIDKVYKELVLTKSYYGNEEYYPKYDNYDAINVNKTKDIPNDYYGVMGVPITFLDKYNPSQFDIINSRKGDDKKDLKLKKKTPYLRILIRYSI
jgi:hypothetical protein